jgi:dethiobiotin synthetase
MGALFVTGTDTGVGKTFVGCALAHAWRAAGGASAS